MSDPRLSMFGDALGELREAYPGCNVDGMALRVAEKHRRGDLTGDPTRYLQSACRRAFDEQQAGFVPGGAGGHARAGAGAGAGGHGGGGGHGGADPATRARGTVNALGGWDRHAHHASQHEHDAASLAGRMAESFATPAEAAAWIATCDHDSPAARFHAPAVEVWRLLETPDGWYCATASNTAQRWAIEAAQARLDALRASEAGRSQETPQREDMEATGADMGAATGGEDTPLLRDWAPM